MVTTERLAESFEEQRIYLRRVAYRMLGSVAEAEDAVQEAWLRLSRAEFEAVENLRAWLTTTVARVCLDMLRTRAARREDSLGVHLPDPIISPMTHEEGPEADAIAADSIGLALLVVFEKLDPAERLALVLHDVCGMTFDEIAPIVDRSVIATRQVTSRARRRIQSEAPLPDADLRKQRRVVEAFLSAVQNADFEALVTLLDPAIVLRADGGAAKGMSRMVRGVEAVTAQAALFSKLGLSNHVVLVNGDVGVVSRLPDGGLLSVIGFTVTDGRVVEMNILADPVRLARLDLAAVAP